jgi:hypothetical protein
MDMGERLQFDLLGMIAHEAARSTDDGRMALHDGLVTREGTIATDGHCLLRVAPSVDYAPYPDVTTVMEQARAAADFHTVAVDPAIMARMCGAFLKMADAVKMGKRLPRRSMLSLVLRFPKDPKGAIVLDCTLPNTRKVDGLLMPQRLPDAL